MNVEPQRATVFSYHIILSLRSVTSEESEGHPPPPHHPHLHLPDVISLETLNHVLHCLLHASLMSLCHS